ncbi:acyl-CoA synthetase MbcS [Niallia sp. NCCP-28]|uniref:acyl-CoA synthetase MbcS n=1 Tax=Niallia sp. NCCP-28 TaxID=2934712 RepID=UPI00207F6763|nr:acyl--CoA ligase [Niallia sp. NCCP-28]GKU81576.1 acyl--CoA ligase [Niallia sp. NCCP-28]
MSRQDLIAPQTYNFVSEIEKCARDKNRLALKWENEDGETKEITYNSLLKLANQMGNVLKDTGLKKGDVVLVIVPRLVEAYQVYLAALKIGLTILPSSEMLRAKDLQYRIQHGDVKGIISYYPFLDELKKVEEINSLKRFVIGEAVEGWTYLDEEAKSASEDLDICETEKTDTAFISYTSGTTGNPKGVVHTHGWAYAHLRTAAPNWLCIEEGDLVWATAGPGWQKWVWSPLLSVLGSGATGFVYHGKFNPRKYLQLLEKYEVNVLCCTPTEYRLMAKVEDIDTFQLTSLRSAVSAGEPLNREVIDVFKKHYNLDVRDGYGQTENTLLLGITKGVDLRPGSMGKPTPGNIVDIVNEHGKVCAVGEVGDIAVHKDTPALFKEYFKEPERTKNQFRGDYYITGDRAKKDENGYFWFEGRSDDIIISSGYTIGPFEVEDALVKHPSVKECAVVASPDPIRGNIVKAFVVLQDGVKGTAELVKELQTYVKELTAPYKYPRKIEFIDDLPKTTSGKTRRVELRENESKK